MKNKILLIEDNPEMRENTTEILELADFVVISAPDGKMGVEAAKAENPDLIICDIMMPVMDGYEVLNELSREEKTSVIPFIFLTAKAERNDLRKGMELGADDYLTKPFDDRELLNAIEVRLKKTDLLKKTFTRNLDGLNEFMSSAKGLEKLDQLSAEKNIRTYAKKEHIFHEGAYPKGIYFINKGKVKTYLTNTDGKELITGLYNEGDFFGYLSLLEESKYTDTADALEETEVCLIPKEDFFGLIYSSAEVSKKFIKMLSNELLTKEDQLIKLAYNSVRKRVAEALVVLCDKYAATKEEKFSMKISRDDLSNIVGTSTETVIRTLSDFKDEGLVEMKGGTITIVNYSKLASLKN